MDARIIPIGNSKGIRLPKRLLVKYGFEETIGLKELDNGILLEKEGTGKLSWTETYQAIARSDEDWSDWANLNPVIGSEISKIRPVVIVSDNMMNRSLKTVVVCPLTSSTRLGTYRLLMH